MKKVKNPHTSLKWPLLDVEEATDSGEQLENPKNSIGHKAISKAIFLGVHTEADSREMDQVLEAEVDLTKVPMLADQGSLVRLYQEMP